MNKVIDPQSLTRDRLRAELRSHKIKFPPDVKKVQLVRLYNRHVLKLNSEFSSDEEMSIFSNQSPKKSTTNAKQIVEPLTETKISNLSDKELMKMMKENGMVCGPITASSRKLYEKKLYKLLILDQDNSSHSNRIHSTGLKSQTKTFSEKFSDAESNSENEEGSQVRHSKKGSISASKIPVPTQARTSPKKSPKSSGQINQIISSTPKNKKSPVKNDTPAIMSGRSLPRPALVLDRLPDEEYLKSVTRRASERTPGLARRSIRHGYQINNENETDYKNPASKTNRPPLWFQIILFIIITLVCFFLINYFELNLSTKFLNSISFSK